VSPDKIGIGGGLGWFFTMLGGPLYSWNLITRFGGVLAAFFFSLAKRLLAPLLLPCDDVLEPLENIGGDIALVKRLESKEDPPGGVVTNVGEDMDEI
jgi:hypothetical protein